MKTSTPARSARPGYSRTPILSAVKRQHADDDAKRGFDPYNRPAPRPVDPVAPPTSQSEREAASRLLATYNSTLTIEE